MAQVLPDITDTSISVSVMKNVFRLLPIVGFVGCIVMLFKLSGGDTWNTDENDDPKKISNRELDRGTLVSIVSALLMNIIGVIMVRIGVPAGQIITNYGFILGPVIGYMLDIGVGTDTGLRKTKGGLMSGAKHVFSKLISAEFLRYIIKMDAR